MTDFVQVSAQSPPQSISEVLAPGIVGLFVQGLETGLVITQLSHWLCLERTESAVVNILVTFVTIIGFVETGVTFASAWRIYVLDFGQLVIPGWTESVHVMLSALVAIPIQAYFIRSCYHIMNRNIYLIIPLILALISSAILAGWVTSWIFHVHAAAQSNGVIHLPVKISPPFVACLAVPAVLDVVITSILFYSLTNLLKRIHAEHLRRRVTRFMIVIWQTAIPPCVCAIALLVKYFVFTEVHPGKRQMWYATIQAMLGKLYVLSLYYSLNNRMDLAHEPPTTYVPTMNTSLGVMSTPARQYVFSVHFPDPEQQCQ
ncbi:hypothetical protein BJV78DRAFT_672325 [Lactifluus subvellereus]|nr:hypothetical protein BJV78DRAFT_672325 [Lactifluus subvellereus]